MEARSVLEVRDVEAAYGDLPALWGVSISVLEGEIVALIGPNGAGKTTTLRAVAGLHRLSAGRITLEGRPTEQLPPHRLVEAGVILVPEGRRLFGQMTVLENLEMGSYLGRARRERPRTLRWVYEMFPVLADRA